MQMRRAIWSAVLGLAVTAAAGCGAATTDGLENSATTSLSVASDSPTPSATSTEVTTTSVTAPPLTSDATTSVATTEESISTPSAEPPTTEAVVETEPVPPVQPATTTPSPTTTPPTTLSSSSRATPPRVEGNGSGMVVVLDPGHNGRNGENPSIINAQVDAGFGETKACNTTGTETNAGYPEHAFTWAVTTRVRDLLVAAGVTVVMTRESDDGVGPCVNERARIGNENEADAVVSIHGDGAAAGDRGFYAMTSERLPNGVAVGNRSSSLATAVRDALVDTGVDTSNYVGSDGLWKRDDLAGLNLSMVPTTMIEMGNMRDSEDAALMKSDAGQDQMAAGIAQGILDFLAAN